MDLEQLKSVYTLSEQSSGAILNQIIKRYTKGKKPVSTPKAIIIGGQPGAGKTILRKLSEIELLKNAVPCNVDNFREFHPLAKEIKRYHEQHFSVITSNIAHHWNRELTRYCRKNGLNYIHETPFKDGKPWNETIRVIKDYGFEVDIKILAVDPRLSMLGIYQRYETLEVQQGFARSIHPDIHDLHCMSLPFAIKQVHQAGLYDNLSIYARSTVLDGDAISKGVSLVAHNPGNPYAVYNAEVNRPWPNELHQYFEDSCIQVLELMSKRGASDENIRQFRMDVGIPESKKVTLCTTRKG